MHLSPYFNDVLWICEKLGLYNLMELHEDYNVHLVQQFYATVVFGSNQERTMVWMSGTTRCTATFHDFSNVIFENFHGVSTPLGLHMHSAALGENKLKLAPLYDEGVVGGSKGLKTLYNLMLRIFRHTIAPSAGNDDAIRGGLVNLLYHTHRTFNAGPETEATPIDVMDFIFEEMFHAILYKKSPSYAPLVMRLINSRAHDSPLGIPPHLTVHTLVSLQQKGHMGPAPRRRYGDDDEEIETERAPSPPRVRRKNASNAPMPTMT